MSYNSYQPLRSHTTLLIQGKYRSSCERIDYVEPLFSTMKIVYEIKSLNDALNFLGNLQKLS